MASLSLRSSTIRLGIFISTLVIAAILVFQLVWLNKIYNREQNEFNQGVIRAIKGLYEYLNTNNYSYTSLNELIENPEPHLYLARITLPVNSDSVARYLQFELEDFRVFTVCHLGIYSSQAGRYVFSGLLKTAGTKEEARPKLPGTVRKYDHLTLYFPNRKQYILAQMNFWIISSVALLLILILFGASLYYFYRQKFLNETQNDFIHNFTHEFKTPVSVISLAADVLKNPTIIEKPDKLATYAGIVEYQASYLKNQTEKLLNFAYTESGHLHFTKERVNINELIKEAINNLAPLITERKANLSLELNARDPFLTGNKDYLVIVIINLLDNAIKYSKDPVIKIRTENHDGILTVSVIDNGVGIEKDQIRNLFKKFFRIKKEDTYSSKGFGIGLAFVKKIVLTHSGKIRVRSEPGAGSDFTIELPVQ